MGAEDELLAIVADVAKAHDLDLVRLDRARAAFRFGAARIETVRGALAVYRAHAEEAAKVLAAYNKNG